MLRMHALYVQKIYPNFFFPAHFFNSQRGHFNVSPFDGLHIWTSEL